MESNNRDHYSKLNTQNVVGSNPINSSSVVAQLVEHLSKTLIPINYVNIRNINDFPCIRFQFFGSI